VVSVTDPYGRILSFLDRSRYFSKLTPMDAFIIRRLLIITAAFYLSAHE
jgi:hypothetical protein